MTFWEVLQLMLIIFGGFCFLVALIIFVGLFVYSGIYFKETKKKGKKNGKN